MHAVVVKVTLRDFEEARSTLVTEVVPRVSQAPGFVAGYWTRSADGNSGLSMVVFDSEDAARAAAEMVPQMPRPESVTIDSVDVREVVAHA
jgi:hypothetical protein